MQNTRLFAVRVLRPFVLAPVSRSSKTRPAIQSPATLPRSTAYRPTFVTMANAPCCSALLAKLCSAICPAAAPIFRQFFRIAPTGSLRSSLLGGVDPRA